LAAVRPGAAGPALRLPPLRAREQFAARGPNHRHPRFQEPDGAAAGRPVHHLVLEGKITAFKTTPVSYSEAGAANMYEVRLTMDVRLIDMQSGEMFYQGSGLSFQETYETDSADFFSQESGSLVRIGAKFASSIVASILENF
jgi:hypothetical protein